MEEWQGGAGGDGRGTERKTDEAFRVGGVRDVAGGVPGDELDLIMSIAKVTSSAEKFAIGIGNDFLCRPDPPPGEVDVEVGHAIDDRPGEQMECGE